jgi:hypothetical protein
MYNFKIKSGICKDKGGGLSGRNMDNIERLTDWNIVGHMFGECSLHMKDLFL